MDNFGNWSAPDDPITPETFLLQAGSYGWSVETDDDGDETYASWRVPNPRFDVRANTDQIEAYEWTIGDELTVTVNGQSEQPKMVDGTAPWDPNTTYVVFNLGDSVNIRPGDFVSVSNGVITKETTVTDLSFTDIDIDLDTVEGEGSPNSHIDLWACGPNNCTNRSADSDERGFWSADFSKPDTDAFNIISNTWVDLQQVDDDGDKTMFGQNTPSFVVFPEWEWFDGNNWPAGNTVTITVQGKPECSVSPVSPGNFFNGGFGEGCNIETGDVVTFTDGDTTLTHIVKNLGVAEVNAEEDTVSGTANSGVVVIVWPHETGQQIQVTAENGNWQVDFTDIFDIKPNDCGRSEIRDELGLSTAVDWCAPKPWLIAFPENDAVEGWEWPAGKTITLTIDNAPEDFTQEEPQK